MKDPRNSLLAKQLLQYSTEVKSGDTLYLELKGIETMALGKEILAQATKLGVTTFWFYNDESILRQFLMHGGQGQFEKQAELHMGLMKQADAYIGVRGSDNAFDLADVPNEKRQLFDDTFYHPVHFEQRVNHTRWVVLRYPNNAMAQLAETSQEAFESFYFDVCCANYQKMSEAQGPLQDLMNATDRVHIKGPETDLQFSIKDIPAVKCDGKRNIPDGEVYTAPVRDSVNGYITYNAPSLRQGVVFNDIRLEFENGKIVNASCSGDSHKLNKIFDMDEGARYIGEFAIGVNPFIQHPMKDILFDEKIAGSFHFTPGQCYEVAPNGNSSSLHWDLVQIQRSDYGGGEIYFDDKLIRKDGKFTDDAMEKSFSAENLRGEGI